MKPREIVLSPVRSAYNSKEEQSVRALPRSGRPETDMLTGLRYFKNAPQPWRTQSTPRLKGSRSCASLGLQKQLPPLPHSESRHISLERKRSEPTHSGNEPGPSPSDEEVTLFASVYATEIRITEVEAKDGYRATKTIIRPTSSSASQMVSRPRAVSNASHVVLTPAQVAKSPIGKLFSARPFAPLTLRGPTQPISPTTPKARARSSSSSSTSSWRIPSLGLTGRKHLRRRSSQIFEEDVDYLQSKLEKEAMGGACAIRVVMEVEHCVIVEPRRQSGRRRYEGHRRQQKVYH